MKNHFLHSSFTALCALLGILGTQINIWAQVAVNDSVYIFGMETISIDLLENDDLSNCAGSYALSMVSLPSNSNDFELDAEEGVLYYTPSASMLEEGGSNEDAFSYAIIDINSGDSSEGWVIVKYDPAMLCELNTCVWPGDADKTGVANASDLLALGLTYGSDGPPREDDGIEWEGLMAEDWNMLLSGGEEVDYKHADCNGDGSINWQDQEAIESNYNENAVLGSSIDELAEVPISLVIQNEEAVQAGDTVWVEVQVGSPINPIENLYGLSFRIEHDNGLAVPGSSFLQFGSSFLTTEAMTIKIDHERPNGMDGAISRTNQIGSSGWGDIAIYGFVMEDVLIGKSQSSYEFGINVSSAALINEKGANLAVHQEGATLVYRTAYAGLSDEVLQGSLVAFPNPCVDQLELQWSEKDANLLELLSLEGKTIVQQNIARGQRAHTLDLSRQQQGFYILRLHSTEGIATRRICLVK